MLPDYNDIKSRISAPPLWFDTYGVPRYDPFTPDHLGVYDVIAVLVEIECQSCGIKMLVGEGWPAYIFPFGHEEPIHCTLDGIVGKYHYGDPPNHGCIGDTMNCIDLRVLQAWEKEHVHEWQRSPEHEIDIP